MKIIITGAAGFIGSNLSKALLERGHSVIGVDNLSYGLESNISEIKDHPRFQFVFGDIANPLILKDFHSDVIVHLASQKIPRYTNALRTLDENYLMLRNIVQKCILDKSKIIFASTSDVYGKNPHVPFHEESDLVIGSTTIKRWAYATSKIYGEQYIIANHEEYGIDFTIGRFFGSYGPNHNLTWWGGPQSGFITKAFNNEEIEIHGDGSQTRTFTYVDDTVDALVHFVEDSNSNNEIFNTGSNPEEEISILGLAELIWKLVNGKDSYPKLKYIPYASFGKYEDVMRRVPDISKLKKFFGFEPKWTLNEGLKKTIGWQRKVLGK